MAAKYLMSWEGNPQYRWAKTKDGKKYVVTCKQLGLSLSKWTKESSYTSANEWWKKQLNEISSRTSESRSKEKMDRLSRLGKMSDWAKDNDPSELERFNKLTHDTLACIDDDELPIDSLDVMEKNVEILELFGGTIPEDLNPDIKSYIFGPHRIYGDRLTRYKKVVKEKTVGHALKVFIDEIKMTQRELTHREIVRYFKGIPDSVWSSETALTSICTETVKNHYDWLISMKFKPPRHNKKLGFFRRFITWLYNNEFIESEPRNLKIKAHRKKAQYSEVKTYTEVKSFVESLPPALKTWGMLCLNCGMTATDLGKLFWSDSNLELGKEVKIGQYDVKVQGLIDRDNWTVRRRRSKTGDHPNSPTVTYKLWDQTIELLLKMPKSSSPLVFTTKNDEPMYHASFTNNDKNESSVRLKDLFGESWRKQRISLSRLRSIAADCLSKNENFCFYRDYYLGHSPNTIATKHYVREKDEPFFRALEYIRKTLFEESEIC